VKIILKSEGHSVGMMMKRYISGKWLFEELPIGTYLGKFSIHVVWILFAISS
jgi:hypothetical protein